MPPYTPPIDTRGVPPHPAAERPADPLAGRPTDLAALGDAILRLIGFGHQRNAVLQRDVGLTLAQARLLEMLVAGGGEQTLHTLGHQTGFSGPTLTGMMDRLAAAGLIERWRHATDRRMMEITLTEAGQACYTRYAARQAARLAAVTATFSDAELATFTRLLGRFIAALEDSR